MKLTTAAAAFADLGIGRRLSTRVYRTGTLSGGTLTGSLWLVGGGDPSLSTDLFASRAFNGAGGQLSDLAAAVRAAGIRHVSGRVFGDESMFDSVRTGPYWKPSYWQDCPPITALSVNKDLISFFKPYAYNQPAVRAADALRGALRKQGVTVGHDPRAGTLPAAAVAVAERALAADLAAGAADEPALRQLLRRGAEQAGGGGGRPRRHHAKRPPRGAPLPGVARHQHDRVAHVRRLGPVAGRPAVAAPDPGGAAPRQPAALRQGPTGCRCRWPGSTARSPSA